jgi:hypothetical protein
MEWLLQKLTCVGRKWRTFCMWEIGIMVILLFTGYILTTYRLKFITLLLQTNVIHNAFSQNISHSSATDSESSQEPVVVKGVWSCEEDSMMRCLVTKFGRKWSTIAQHMRGRNGKQCRERWHNHLDPTFVKRPWTIQEDTHIREYQARFGNRY